MEAAVKHTKTIDDFDDLVDLRTLGRHCFGLEPSAFVLRAIAIEEKNEYYYFSSFALSFFFLFFLSVFLFFFCKNDNKI